MPAKKRKPKAKKVKKTKVRKPKTKARKAKVKKSKPKNSKPKKVKAKKTKSRSKKVKKSKTGSRPKKKAKPKARKPRRLSKPKIDRDVRDELEKQGKDIFYREQRWTLGNWIRKYSPVLITLIVGLGTYFFLIFYLFYPTTLLHGHYVQLLALVLFIFFIAGVLIYLGIRAELLFVRLLSFIFVFVIFTFLLLFILLANTMQGLGI